MVLDGVSGVTKGNRAWYYVDGKKYVISYPKDEAKAQIKVEEAAKLKAEAEGNKKAITEIEKKIYKLKKVTAEVQVLDKSSRAFGLVKHQNNLSNAIEQLNKAKETNNAKNIAKYTKLVNKEEASLYITKTSPPKGTWVIRLDTPHPGAEFDHINLNKDLVNVNKAPGEAKFSDPHYKLPKNGIRVSCYAKVI